MAELISITREAWERLQILYPAADILGLRVVDGVVVPKEPTPEMVVAGWGAAGSTSKALDCYRAMLSAAQEEESDYVGDESHHSVINGGDL